MDITGALDHACWPMILSKVKYQNCPARLFNIVLDYLNERSVKVSYSDFFIN